ncbi:MAG: Cas6 Crispr, partial [Ramlibacter sp.]|nr:Cas6 Crispr [Ramlibacter sp.]
GLTRAESLRVLRRGIGPQRLLGCGLFVPHKSAAAVGAAG